MSDDRGIAKIKYPGPEPLDLKGHDDLVARTADTTELFDACTRHHILEVTARSGVGKTSFVKAGLVYELEERRKVYVPEYGTWAHATAELDLLEPANLLVAAEMLYRIWIGVDPLDTRPIPQLLAEPAEGRWTVVVLDQMEELIRYRPHLADELLKLAGRTAVAATIPHVLVARTEYREELAPAEVSGAVVWSSRLGEIEDDDALADIVRRPARRAGVEVESGAEHRLIAWWKEARGEPSASEGTANAQVGLLHFQALLWSFQRWAAVAHGAEPAISEALVAEFGEVCLAGRVGRGEQLDELPVGAAILGEALLRYVEDKAARLTEPREITYGKTRHRLLWRNGPRLMLARIAPALSAAGYKQPQSLLSLVPQAVSDELTPRVAAKFGQELQRRPADARSISRDFEPPRGAGIAEHWHEAGDASVNEDGSTRLVTQEMVDCLRAGLDAMASANILRVFEQADPADPIYELVHDGMGVALNAWAERFLEQPAATIGVLAAQKGRVVSTGVDRKTLDDLSDDELAIWGGTRDASSGQVTFSALRWPSCLIGDPRGEDLTLDVPVVFENVRFLRCDFTGAYFRTCVFRDVVFESCTLRATALRACRFEGVRFVAGDTPQDLDLLTIIEPQPGADVRFVGANAKGVFLQGLCEGDWTFEDSRVNHLVIETEVKARVAFTGSTIARAVSVAGAGIDAQVGDPDSVHYVSLDATSTA